MAKKIDAVDDSFELLSVDATFTVSEVCQLCQIDETELSIYVEHGIIDIETLDVKRLSHDQLDRLQRARRLQVDLELNHAGAALALDLLDTIKVLKRELALLKR